MQSARATIVSASGDTTTRRPARRPTRLSFVLLRAPGTLASSAGSPGGAIFGHAGGDLNDKSVAGCRCPSTAHLPSSS
eukprot:scaffold4267_cov124-Isochrysis_galbana.AAC.7